MKKRIVSIILAAGLLLSLVVAASAKTSESAKAENIFFYASNAEGGAVLLKVIPLSDLKAISHGQPDGKNYYISSTDNYPTTQYCEARGVTVPELVDYVKRVTSVKGADKLTFSGEDAIRLMATDSFGSYNRVWTARELYETPRYYFEGLYDAKTGWKSAWEIAGEDISKFGVTLDEYNAKYKDADPYYNDKRAVFSTGIKTVPILSTESFSGRTTSDALSASTEAGIADYIAKNGGTVAGSLKNALTDETALRLALPMTEADLMAAHRTAFDNFKWTYNLQLTMNNAQFTINSLGAVAEPVASVTVSGDTLTITMSCATAGASIYYSFDGAPQIPYTKPVTVDIQGRNLASDPVTFYAAAVREGYTDAGVVTFKYPGLAPAFKTQYSALMGRSVVFEAAEGVAPEEFSAWMSAITFVTMKPPSSPGYVRIDQNKISMLSGKLGLGLPADLFTETGSYSFVFHASGYADKSASLTVKKPAPEIRPPRIAKIGMPLVFTFDDADFQNGLSLYVTPPGGESVMIAANWLDRTLPGKVTLKAAYFGSASCAVKAPGTYKFSFVSSRYEPGTVEIQLTVDSGQLTVLEDVSADAWYFDAVQYVMGAELFDAPDGKFSPEAPMTRGMLAEALYRLEGSPAVTDQSPFTDASAPSVVWAASAGVVNGMGDGTFAPDASVTREQIAVMLYRYRQLTADKGQLTAGDLSVFSDGGDVSDWAIDAMRWAVGAKLINGMGDGTVNPQGAATRAQVAQILLNWAG